MEGITIRAVRGKNTVTVKVGGVDTEMFVDSGAEVSIVPTYLYKKEMGKLQPSSERLRTYGTSKSLNVEAKFIANMTTNQGACTHGWVYVVEGDEQLQPLLGDTEATALGFITFRPEGREPPEQELSVNKITDHVQVGKGQMPDLNQEQQITEAERKQCWKIVNKDKYKPVFDPKHIGKMHKREVIILQGIEIRLLYLNHIDRFLHNLEMRHLSTFNSYETMRK